MASPQGPGPREVVRAGTVPRFAQQRVDERVKEIMANREVAGHRDSSSDHAYAARRFLRRYDRSRI